MLRKQPACVACTATYPCGAPLREHPCGSTPPGGCVHSTGSLSLSGSRRAPSERYSVSNGRSPCSDCVHHACSSRVGACSPGLAAWASLALAAWASLALAAWASLVGIADVVLYFPIPTPVTSDRPPCLVYHHGAWPCGLSRGPPGGSNIEQDRVLWLSGSHPLW